MSKRFAVVVAVLSAVIPVSVAVAQTNPASVGQPSEQAVAAARSTIETIVAANLGKTPEEIAAAVVSALQGTPGAVINAALSAMQSSPNPIAGVSAANSGAVNAALSRVSQVAQVQMRVEAAVAGFGPNANAADVQAAIAQATQGVADVSITNLALGAAQSTQSGAASPVVAALSTAKTIAQSAVTQTQLSQSATGQQTGGLQQSGQTPAGQPPSSGGGATGGGGGSGYVRTT